MGVERPGLPFSPTAIGLATGMDVPGAGTVEEMAGVKGCPEPERKGGRQPGVAAARVVDLTDLIPGQSGAEALAALPQDDPEGF